MIISLVLKRISSWELCVYLLMMCAVRMNEAGILSPLSTLSNPINNARDLISKLVPQPVKDFLNYDPVPDWVPDPKDFIEDKNLTDLSEESINKRNHKSRSIKFNETIKDDTEIRNDIPIEEKGNFHGIARDVIRSFTNSFSTISTGLDTDKVFFSGLLNDFKDQVKAIYPGTQWCGDGNIARTKKQLGFFRNTDKCCRDHDNCSDFIEKNEMKYNLYNKGLFTRSHCNCDTQFYNCLKESNDMIASQIGMAYFTVLGPQCFKKEYPILYCRIKVGLTKRCIEYELNNSTDKIYQWFDNPEY